MLLVERLFAIFEYLLRGIEVLQTIDVRKERFDITAQAAFDVLSIASPAIRIIKSVTQGCDT